MANEEYLIKIGILQEQAGQIRQQVEFIEQNLQEIENVRQGLKTIEDKESNEMMTHIGRGVFAKTKLLEREFLVNVGAEVVLKKSLPETLEMLKKQASEMQKVKENLLLNFAGISEALQMLVADTADAEKRFKY
ncbi:MAG: prefoldin subunit alpha [Nanoarchaeota archaeon]